jgi:hypothetical protein
MDAKDIAEELQETNVGDEADAAQVPDQSPPEKMLSVSQVNELVKKAKLKGERKMQEQLDAAKQQIEQLQAQQAQGQPQGQAPQGQQQGQQGLTPELQAQVMQMLQMKQQEDERKRHAEQIEQEVKQVADQYFGKMATGKNMFEDFEAITADFNPAEFPQLVFLANQVDNTPAVIYELSKNPGKLADLAVLVEKSPNLARAQIAKLSQSIKRNEEAKSGLQEAQEPLDRLKPSPTGTDGKKNGIRDFKQATFLRG